MPAFPADQHLVTNPAALLFRRHFGRPPAHVFRAPVSLTLLGEWGPYAKGLSLTVAVDRHVSVAASPRIDGRIELVNPALASDAFWLTGIEPRVETPWASPIKQTLMALRERGVPFSGFSVAIHDRVPPGLPANAALRCATANLIRELHPFTLTDTGLAAPPRRNERTQRLPAPTEAERIQLARLCDQAGAGDSGCEAREDHFTPMSGRAWQALAVDWQSRRVESWPFAGTAVVLCDAGERRPETSPTQHPTPDFEAAARRLGVKTLRSLEPSLLKERGPQLDEITLAAINLVILENHWIARSEAALRAGDHHQLGQFLSLSHEQARDALGRVPPESDTLITLARGHPACLGARAALEGRRITTLNLVNYHEVERFLVHLVTEAKKRLGRLVHPTVLPVADGIARPRRRRG